jgi:hypothetical protein
MLQCDLAATANIYTHVADETELDYGELLVEEVRLRGGLARASAR